MSWDDYKATIKGLGFDRGQAIIDRNTGAPWTTGAPGSAQELKTIAAAFKTPGSLFATGIMIGGVKYTTVRHDEDNIVGKHKNEAAIAIGVTGKAIVIGVCGPDLDANNAVARLGHKVVDYLKGIGY